jgi:hypothetical protein
MLNTNIKQGWHDGNNNLYMAAHNVVNTNYHPNRWTTPSTQKT